jgi:hypothetical protein
MAFTKLQAKSILDKSEFALYAVATGTRLQKLTKAEVDDYVVRSRTARDKWIDLSKKQRRTSQAKAGQRQTTDNSRSEQKAALLQEIHQAFIDRQSAVTAGKVQVAAGVKATPIARRTRKVINRVDRAVVRQEIAQHQETLMVEKRNARKKSAPTPAVVSKAVSTAKPVGRPRANAAPATSAPATGAAASVPTKDAKKSVAKPIVAKVAPAKVKPAKAVPTKAKPAKVIVTKKVAAAIASKSSRAKATAKRTATMVRQTGKPVMAEISKKAHVPHPDSEGLSKAQVAANRSLGAKASKNRVAIGGNTRIKSHVAAANRRQQTRRDSK